MSGPAVAPMWALPAGHRRQTFTIFSITGVPFLAVDRSLKLVIDPLKRQWLLS